MLVAGMEWVWDRYGMGGANRAPHLATCMPGGGPGGLVPRLGEPVRVWGRQASNLLYTEGGGGDALVEPEHDQDHCQAWHRGPSQLASQNSQGGSHLRQAARGWGGGGREKGGESGRGWSTVQSLLPYHAPIPRSRVSVAKADDCTRQPARPSGLTPPSRGLPRCPGARLQGSEPERVKVLDLAGGGAEAGGGGEAQQLAVRGAHHRRPHPEARAEDGGKVVAERKGLRDGESQQQPHSLGALAKPGTLFKQRDGVLEQQRRRNLAQVARELQRARPCEGASVAPPERHRDVRDVEGCQERRRRRRSRGHCGPLHVKRIGRRARRQVLVQLGQVL
eukprot:scaffold1127_cov93-Isochrysis_galbana.AAC.4